MKTLLIYPPQWNPMSPYLSAPVLAGQLEAAGRYLIWGCSPYRSYPLSDISIEFRYREALS